MSTEDYKQMVTPCDDPYPMTTQPTPAPSDTPRTSKATIEKIITNNRRPFAIHQIWAMFDSIERKHERELAAKEAEVAALLKEKQEWSKIYRANYGHDWDARRNNYNTKGF